MGKKRKSADGERHGSLVVLRDGPNRGKDRRVWCKCDCGTEKLIGLGSIRNGHTVSCGCVNVAKFTARATKHGNGDHPLYECYRAMLARCRNPRAKAYAIYGGRGI